MRTVGYVMDADATTKRCSACGKRDASHVPIPTVKRLCVFVAATAVIVSLMVSLSTSESHMPLSIFQCIFPRTKHVPNMDSGYQTDEDDDLAWESVVGDIRVNANQVIIVRCDHPDDSIEFEFWQECIRAILSHVKNAASLIHFLSREDADRRAKALLEKHDISRTLTGFGMWYQVDHVVVEDFCQLSISVRFHVWRSHVVIVVCFEQDLIGIVVLLSFRGFTS